MPRRCTICSHDQREAIELAIVRNGPYRDIAGRFGVEHKAVGGHHRNHMAEPEPEPTAADRERERQAEHRERLRIEKHHVERILGGIIAAAPTDPKIVPAVRELNRMHGYYAPREVAVSLALDRMSTADLERLETLPDDELARELANAERFVGNGKRW